MTHILVLDKITRAVSTTPIDGENDRVAIFSISGPYKAGFFMILPSYDNQRLYKDKLFQGCSNKDKQLQIILKTMKLS